MGLRKFRNLLAKPLSCLALSGVFLGCNPAQVQENIRVKSKIVILGECGLLNIQDGVVCYLITDQIQGQISQGVDELCKRINNNSVVESTNCKPELRIVAIDPSAEVANFGAITSRNWQDQFNTENRKTITDEEMCNRPDLQAASVSNFAQNHDSTRWVILIHPQCE